MANYQREVYEPTFEDGPAYDFRDDEVEDARARLPLLIVIALLVLAAFAGVVWLAYNQGVERGRIEAPAIVAAPPGPARTAPAEQNDAVPYTGLKIYSEPVPPDAEAAASALAETATAPAATVVPVPAPTAPAPEVATVAPASPPPAPAVAVAPPPPAPQAAAPLSPGAVSSAVAGGAVLQIGAYPSEALAADAWQAFRQRHPAIAAEVSSDVQQANLGERGIWYRLRIGPFAGNAAANATCDQVKAQGGTCFVAAP